MTRPAQILLSVNVRDHTRRRRPADGPSASSYRYRDHATRRPIIRNTPRFDVSCQPGLGYCKVASQLAKHRNYLIYGPRLSTPCLFAPHADGLLEAETRLPYLCDAYGVRRVLQ